MYRFFINRPIVAMVIAILMVLVGLVSMLSLPISKFPNIVPPEIRIQTTFVGADAPTLEQSVATPIEQQMSGVDNMNYMYSISANNGVMRMVVNFDVKTDPNVDQELAELRENQAEPQMPADVRSYGVQLLKSPTAPMMLVALYSPKGTYDATFLANYAYINIVDEVTRLKGISNIGVFGAGQYAMRFWVKPDQLAKLNVTVNDIVTAINAQNTVNPAGQIGGPPSAKGQEFTYAISAQGRLVTEEEFGNIVIRENTDGSMVRLKDVARIELGAQIYTLRGRLDGSPSAVMAIYQLPGSNALDAAKRVRQLMEELKQRFPNDLDYAVSLDTTLAVSQGMNEILMTLWEALLLVILVVYIFLQGWRAALIPMLAVPVSLIGTFALFPLFGFSINTLSLFGLVLAIGLVVDDAIVVVEATERHIEEGATPKDAALLAMHEVAGPVVALALILAAVFIPTVFIAGITGRLYQQFAVTIAISVLISAFNALSLSPALAAKLLRPQKATHGPLRRFFDWFNRVFGKATHGYVHYSGALIRKSALSLLLLAGIAVVALMIGHKLPTSFLPDEDQGYLYLNVQLPLAASLDRTDDACKKIEAILAKTPGVQHYTTVMGFSILSGVQSTYNATFFVTLAPWDERKKPEEQYAAIKSHLNQELGKVSEANASVVAPPAIPGVGSAGGFQFILEDRAGKQDQQFLTDNVNKFMEAARKRKELSGLFTTYLPSVPQVVVKVDRDKVLKQGVDLNQVYRTLQTFMGGFFVNYFNRFGRQWQVYLQAEGDYRKSPDQIGLFYVRNNQGQSVPLSTFTTVTTRLGPEFEMHYNEYRCAQINGSAAPGYSSGEANAALEEVFAQTMPRGEMGFDYLGMSFQERQAAQGVSPVLIFGFSVVCVFLILAAQYESWSLPFSVLLGTPVAVFGAFLALYSRGFENNVYVQIGLIMLIGLAAKNAILIVAFAKTEYEKGKSLREAALTGARIRLRPILMTSFAFILGCVPLWVASGSGGISRQTLGTVVVGGMLSATLLGIFIVPVTFYVVEKLTLLVKGEKPHPEAPASGSPSEGGHGSKHS